MGFLLVLHPLILFPASVATVILTAAYTDRSSPRRRVALAFLVLCASIYPWSSRHFLAATGWVARVSAGRVFWNVIDCFDRLVLRDWDYMHYGTDQVQPRKGESERERLHHEPTRYFGTRMDFGSEVFGRARGAGLFWEVKNVPYFSNEDPDFVPSRTAFVLVQTVAVVATYFVHNLAVRAQCNLNPTLLESQHIPLLTRLSDITFHELKVRTISTFGYWTVQYAMMQFFFSFHSILGALANRDSIKFARPLFGSPRDAYTLRNFWGKLWHQTLRPGVEGVSDFVAHKILSLPHRGLLQRYTKIFCSFALSGMMHTAADAGVYHSIRQSGALQFFCMQALGIMMEDGVKALCGRHLKARLGSTAPMVEKALGYTWVILFLIWTSPCWVFPLTLQSRREDALLSFSAVKPLFFGPRELV